MGAKIISIDGRGFQIIVHSVNLGLFMANLKWIDADG